MTCIVAVADGDRVVMGGDGAGVGGDRVEPRADAKVFRNGAWVFGVAGSFRLRDLLAYRFQPPTPTPDTDLDPFMALTFVDALRACLKDGGFAQTDNDRECGGLLLAAWRGAVWRIDSDYQVGRPALGYTAIGSGAPYALGALYVSDGDDAETRVLMALSAAVCFSGSVTEPFRVLATET